jgi:hypothetical protein
MSIWYDAIKDALKGIKEIVANKEAKRNKVYEAVEAVHSAANETTDYLQQCMRKVEGPNKEIRKIWENAATKVRGLNKDLYIRCLSKAEYWADPSKWTAKEIKDANIALESIRKDSKRILETL